MIELDGNHVFSAQQEAFGKSAASRPDLDGQLNVLPAGRIGNDLQSLAAGEEMLTQFAPSQYPQPLILMCLMVNTRLPATRRPILTAGEKVL